MNRIDKTLVGIIILFIMLLFIFWKSVDSITDTIVINAKLKTWPPPAAIMISRKWEMPHQLKEISGIVWLDENHFACVQDEAGEIFIFNTGQNKIEKIIKVTAP